MALGRSAARFAGILLTVAAALAGGGCAAAVAEDASDRSSESATDSTRITAPAVVSEDLAMLSGSRCAGIWDSTAGISGWHPGDLGRWQEQMRDAWVVSWGHRLDLLAFEVDVIRADAQVQAATDDALAAVEALEAAGTVSVEARQTAAARYREAHLRHLAALDARSDVSEHRPRYAGETGQDLVNDASETMPPGLAAELQDFVWQRLDTAAEGLHIEVLAALAAIEHRDSSDADSTAYRYPPDWAPVDSGDIRYEAASDPRRAELAAQMYPYRDQAVEPFRSVYGRIDDARGEVSAIAAAAQFACG